MQIKAKKSLGQHFLNSNKVLSQIIASAEIKKDQNILEIGPGTGVLTEELLKAGAKVIAVEKDRRAYDLLKEKYKNHIEDGRLILILGDILTIGVNNIPDPFAIVANIPYYITGAILEKFLEEGPRPEKMVLLVQREVAERIVAKDGRESVLSISVKAFGNPRIAAKVPRGAFVPAPKVDSAILVIDNIAGLKYYPAGIVQASQKQVETDNASKFFKILKAGFAHKRKYAISNLAIVFDQPKLENIWDKLNLDKKIRPEKIKLESWFGIAKMLD